MILYWIGWSLSRAIARFFGRWSVQGAAYMPKTGGVILAPNHISYLDPPVAAGAIFRQVHFMAKEELFKSRVLRFILRAAGTFPVRRGAADRAAIRNAIGLLNAGKVVGIFPEGTRSEDGNLREPEQGLGMLVLKAKVPVLPMAIIGTDQVLRRGSALPHFGKIKVNIGEPLDFSDLYDRASERAAIEEIGRRTMAAIAELREQIS